MVLDTPAGEQKVKICILYGEDDDAPVAVGLEYGGRTAWGHGREYDWLDAFADLQSKLPRGVRLMCCAMCRHGNFCPVGNEQNEVFCTKDVEVRQKEDLYFYTEDSGERRERSRRYTSVCRDFAEQSHAFFTYNDYLHYAEKQGLSEKQPDLKP